MIEKFKTKDEVDEYLSGRYITCLLCFKKFKSLGKHLSHTHEMPLDDYKIIYGLPHSRGLVAKATSLLMGDSLRRRREAGDPTLMPWSAVADKAHYAPKRKPVHYNFDRLHRQALRETEKRKQKSRERIKNIDWDSFLRMVEMSNKASWSLRTIPGMPSCYDVQRKRDMDPGFAKKYDALKETIKIIHRYKEPVKRLRGQGMTTALIAECLGIGKTTVKRILLDGKEDSDG